MINLFNNLDDLGKVLVIVIVIAFLLLIGLVIYLVSSYTKDDEIDTRILDEVRNYNNKNAKKIAVKIDTNEKVGNEVMDNREETNKFDIYEATKQMQEDIENNSELTEFEMEQEEKSIISYEELLKKVKQDNEESKVKANIQTVELDKKESEEEFNYNTEILDFSDIEIKRENTNSLLEQDDIKEMLSIDNVDVSLYSNDEFLNALKELRDTLK